MARWLWLACIASGADPKGRCKPLD